MPEGVKDMVGRVAESFRWGYEAPGGEGHRYHTSIAWMERSSICDAGEAVAMSGHRRPGEMKRSRCDRGLDFDGVNAVSAAI